MKHILVGISFSDLTAVTLRYSIKLAQYFGAKLTVVHIAKPPKGFTQLDVVDNDAPALAEHLEGRLAALKEVFYNHFGKQHHQISVDFQVIYGLPSDQLILLSRKLSPDLLVIGVPEHKYWLNLRFVNRPMEIADSIKSPVLLVPITGAFRLVQQMVYATNFSLEDVGALMDLKVWMDIFGTKIHCLHICKKEEDRPDAERKMSILKKVFTDERFKFTIEVGDDEDMLESYLVTDKANMVVMLKRNKAIWYDSIKPSLTEKIAEDTWIPLLIYNQK